MLRFTLDEMRRLSKTELSTLKKVADKGDLEAQFKMAMCILYAQAEGENVRSCQTYLEKASAAGNVMAALLGGYVYEHGLGTSKDYAKAVAYYSQAYDLLYDIIPAKNIRMDSAKALKEIEQKYDKVVGQVARLVATKNFSIFQNGHFLFPWTVETRKAIQNSLPQLSKSVSEFGQLYECSRIDLKQDKQGKWEYAYQDTLLMPLEVMKTLAARDYLEQFLDNNGFQRIPSDIYFNDALGRCLIDDDDAYDNDYIIGGLLNMAGHDDSPLWQYRVGLWYEYSDLNIEPKTAAKWYEQVGKDYAPAKKGLERVRNKLEYRMLNDPKVGTAEECKALSLRSSKNPQCSLTWIIESALRGDDSSIKRLEQVSSFSNTDSIYGKKLSVSDLPKPFFSKMEEEVSSDKKAKTEWYQKIQEEIDYYRKLIAEEERKRREAEVARRKAEEEARRKAEEAKRRAEEAKRKAEEEARRKAEEAKRRAEQEAIRKAKAAEEAKRRAEEAKRKAEEEARRKAEEAKRRAEQEAIRRAKAAEEAKRRAEEAKRKAEEEAKAEAELCKKLLADLSNIEEKYKETSAKWEKEGLNEFNSLSRKLESAEDNLRTALNKIMCKWWQIPFYTKGEWSADKALSVSKREGRDIIDSFKKKEAGIEKTAEKLEVLLRTDGAEKNSSLLSSKQKEAQKIYKQYNKEIAEAISVKEEIEKQISRMNSGKMYRSKVEPTFNGKRSAISVAVCLLCLLIACFTYNSMKVVSEEELNVRYDAIYNAGEYGLRIVVKDGKKGLINKKGSEIIAPQYDDILPQQEDGLMVVVQNSKKGLMDNRGKVLLDIKYDEIREPVEKEVNVIWREDEKDEISKENRQFRIFALEGKKGLISILPGYTISCSVMFEAEYDSIYFDSEDKQWAGMNSLN